MSLATDQNTGGVVDGIAARFAAWDARRREQLDALIHANPHRHESEGEVPLEPLPGELRAVPTPPKGFAPGTPPHDQPASPAKETTMPRGKLDKPRACCGALGTKHRAGCSEAGKPTPAAPKPPAGRAAPAKKPPAPKRLTAGVVLSALTVPELVQLIADAKLELDARETALQEMLEELRAAKGGAA